jgi:hypothetical protein
LRNGCCPASGDRYSAMIDLGTAPSTTSLRDSISAMARAVRLPAGCCVASQRAAALLLAMTCDMTAGGEAELGARADKCSVFIGRFVVPGRAGRPCSSSSSTVRMHAPAPPHVRPPLSRRVRSELIVVPCRQLAPRTQGHNTSLRRPPAPLGGPQPPAPAAHAQRYLLAAQRSTLGRPRPRRQGCRPAGLHTLHTLLAPAAALLVRRSARRGSPGSVSSAGTASCRRRRPP